jgi:hypothetical protein
MKIVVVVIEAAQLGKWKKRRESVVLAEKKLVGITLGQLLPIIEH